MACGASFFGVWFELVCGSGVYAGQVLRVVTLWCIVAGMRCEECGEVVPARSGRVPKFCSGVRGFEGLDWLVGLLF